MNEQDAQKEITNWREEITEPAEVFKLADGESAVITFKDEGVKNIHTEFGARVIFKVYDSRDKLEKVWYVTANNFNLLGQIKALGILTDIKVNVKRTGSRRTDTRYVISKTM